MLKEHAKLMVLLEQAQEIIGRKKMQKIVYISKKFRFDFQQKFNFYMYGPYSDELSLQIEELAELGFIHEIEEKKSGYTQYKYALSGQGEQYLSLYPTQIQGYKAFIDVLNGESSRFLELVSTMLYFDHMKHDELLEKVRKVKSKQKYTDAELQHALTFIDQLKAERRKKGK